MVAAYDSLVLAVVLEQQTELRPTQIMTDTGAYSDVVFGLFRLLGYLFYRMFVMIELLIQKNRGIVY